jgi:hypothetical protein
MELEMEVNMWRHGFFAMIFAFTLICITCTNDESRNGYSDIGEEEDTLYNLTFEAGEGGSYAAGTHLNVEGTYKKGARISLPPPRSFPDYVFDKWVSSNGGYFDDANKSNTNFIMPASDTTITATFKKQLQ